MADKKNHGGHRPGAGRPSKYGESTQVIRVPKSLAPRVAHFLKAVQEKCPIDTTTIAQIYRPAECVIHQSLTLFATRVEAGFPSPADDYVEGQLDLNDHLIKHPAATF
jgi:DNA polymerase V